MEIEMDPLSLSAPTVAFSQCLRSKTFPPIQSSHLMVWMAMNRLLFGPDHSEPLDKFSEPSTSHRDYSPNGWGSISTEAYIVANELYVRCQHQVETTSSEDCTYISAACYLPPYHKLGPRESNGTNHQMPIESPKYGPVGEMQRSETMLLLNH